MKKINRIMSVTLPIALFLSAIVLICTLLYLLVTGNYPIWFMDFVLSVPEELGWEITVIVAFFAGAAIATLIFTLFSGKREK